MTFRARLTLFFVAIVLTPLVVLAVAGGRLKTVEAVGHVDGRLEGGSFGIANTMNAQIERVSRLLTPDVAARAFATASSGGGLGGVRQDTGLDYLVVVGGGKVIASSARAASFVPGVRPRPSLLAGGKGRVGLVADRRITVVGRSGSSVWGGLFRDARFLGSLPFDAITLARGRVVASTVAPPPAVTFEAPGSQDAGRGWRGLCICEGSEPSGVAILARPAATNQAGVASLRLLAGVGIALGALIAFVLARLLAGPLQRLADTASSATGGRGAGDEVARVHAAFDAMSRQSTRRSGFRSPTR